MVTNMAHNKLLKKAMLDWDFDNVSANGLSSGLAMRWNAKFNKVNNIKSSNYDVPTLFSRETNGNIDILNAN